VPARFARALALLLLSAPLAAAGCGGDDGSGKAAPDVWTRGVCRSLTHWQDRMRERVEILRGDVATAVGLDQVREDVARFLGDVTGTTNTLVSDVARAGPDVEEGEALAADLRGGIEQLAAVLAQAREDAENLPSRPGPLQRELGELSASIQTEMASAVTVFLELEQRYDVPEVDQAFEDEEACQAFRG
jgi:hypothetical protein